MCMCRLCGWQLLQRGRGTARCVRRSGNVLSCRFYRAAAVYARILCGERKSFKLRCLHVREWTILSGWERVAGRGDLRASKVLSRWHLRRHPLQSTVLELHGGGDVHCVHRYPPLVCCIVRL